ncbi:hypothetical protein PFICI_09679 [Pestalotiopsis fici W106-1]|uniref:glutathione transferase n=1 Tax=Pestalotiopsis fici (strain W106-1 / CGMCC3.15140) TaxID=1229662 RepID=W3WWW0_PESFW|nr:uncharacterized protein PFICI_09679 [Pestalotiopsis fici W106-1]ETS77617.1 hypothetical protein PFICI_09679 [Pestalotiopsis fici W106-1]
MGHKVIQGDLAYDGRVIIYILQADQTNYINYIKPLILAEELQLRHVLSVIDTRSTWYYQVHPERYVPAIKDWCPETKKELIVFESTACLQYIAECYDKDGYWAGRNSSEKAAVLSWTAYQTAGLGPTAKYWLYFARGYPNRQNPESLPKTVAKLHQNCVAQWDILERRLEIDGQQYVALPDRPTIADLSYFPFAMPWMFSFLDVDLEQYPKIKAWGEKMLARPAVQSVLAQAPKYGHDTDEAGAT